MTGMSKFKPGDRVIIKQENDPDAFDWDATSRSMTNANGEKMHDPGPLLWMGGRVVSANWREDNMETGQELYAVQLDWNAMGDEFDADGKPTGKGCWALLEENEIEFSHKFLPMAGDLDIGDYVYSRSESLEGMLLTVQYIQPIEEVKEGCYPIVTVSWDIATSVNIDHQIDDTDLSDIWYAAVRTK